MNQPDPVTRLTKDLIQAAKILSHNEARFLVDSYYQMQENRIRGTARLRELTKSGEPHGVLAWLADQDSTLEQQIKRALQSYAEAHPTGQWALSVFGIGPVISAGLMAHIDITRAPTAGHIWSFAGLDPTKTWEKGQRRPWNASLKTLCWKIGQSFMKFSNADECFYGRLYRERKQQEVERNEAGVFSEQAKIILAAKKFSRDTKARSCYEEGKLPPAHIDARARRYAVKLFLAHWHEVAYRNHFGTEPPLPYPIAILGHAHRINPPRLKTEP